MTENFFLTGNFGPVADEHTARDLRVTGRIPESLEGRLLRIGPNRSRRTPRPITGFSATGWRTAWRCAAGARSGIAADSFATTRWVAAKGWPPVAGPQREFAMSGGIANTNIISHAGKTLAIVEGGNLPVELSSDLETIARSDFAGTLPTGFSAHPKRDPDTGELHAAVYGRRCRTDPVRRRRRRRPRPQVRRRSGTRARPWFTTARSRRTTSCCSTCPW
jgi:carotenoid cleavage dioxygenase